MNSEKPNPPVVHLGRLARHESVKSLQETSREPLSPYEQRERRLELVVECLVWLILLGIGVLVFVLVEVA